MRAEYLGNGLVRYEKAREELLLEAVAAMARLDAKRLGDAEAAQVSILFDQWTPGAEYQQGERICDEHGNLYRVVQEHTAQEDWRMERTPALYTRLGVTAEEPDAIPQWVQPLGAHDAYAKGDKVRHNGKVYEATLDANIWAPEIAGWVEVAE